MKEKQPLSGRVKKLSEEVEQQFSHLEQQPPNKPSFLLVVLLAGVAVIIIFILAIVFLHLDSGRLGTHSFRKHPTAQLVLPSVPTPPLRASA